MKYILPTIKKKYTILTITRRLGCNIIDDPGRHFDLAIFWQDSPLRQADQTLNEISQKKTVININCSDITKEHIAEVHKRILGYDLDIDPLTYEGPCVEKSNDNGLHDGRIIQCPISTPKEGCVYNKLVEAQVDEKYTEEMRIPIFGTIIPFMYLKYHPIEDRFNLSRHGVVVQPEDRLSPDEIKDILRFCEDIGLDFGELDVLRDKHNQNIYIVDANNTPTFRFKGVPRKDKSLALKLLPQAFRHAFFPDD